MKVKDVMMRTPYFGTPWANLGVATELMWKGNCGFLPVLNLEGRVCGVVTDRDICVALGTRNVTAGELQVGKVSQRQLHACNPEDDIHIALQSMRDGHVRRLAVVDKNGKLAGVVSMDDILLHAEPSSFGNEPELSANEVVRTYRWIMKKDLLMKAKKTAA